MQNIFSSNIFVDLLTTLIAAVIITLLYFVTAAILTKKIEEPKDQRRRKVRLFYVMAVFFIFVLARIWVEGFTQLLAVLGLVSAALVITNKEIIMNFSGWLIIIWRGLFSEDDLIEIQQYKGYVRSIRVLYFSLLEVDKEAHNVITGRMIRIPNGLVINNPVVNFSPAHLLEQHFSAIFDKSTDMEAAKAHVKTAVETALQSFYKDKKEYTSHFLQKRSKKIASLIDLNPVIAMKPRYGIPSGIEVCVRYYCYASDQEAVDHAIWRCLFSQLAADTNIKLAL
jgi:small-conductance mechanosensitive channel